MQNKMLVMLFMIMTPFAFAQVGSAKIERYKGYVIVKSGKKVFRLKKRGLILKNGDFVQTKKGMVKLRFRDGARMTVRPFSSTRIGMKTENGRQTRRVTCFAGKLWFKSGKKSKVKNFMQTPNMVCGLRGTEVEIGAFPKKKKIGSITRFIGIVYVQRGRKVLRVRRTGIEIEADDRIQTKRGRAIITLHDRALIKVRPFSRIRVQEKKKQGKTKRRVTCFSGKLWMKSGFNKKIKNYVQTPNMVCGLRGTEVEIAAISKHRQIGRLTYIKGFVLLRSGRKVLRVRKPGRILYAGDHIQTRRGRAKINFRDGAVLKVRSFSSSLIQESKKKKKSKRRITCFTGKLWFKSGKKSKIKNFTQTPTMVCGLRGTEVEIGFNAINNQSMSNTLSGNTDITGDAFQGNFENPGEASAQASSVFNGYNTALETGSFAAVQNAIDNSINSLAKNPSNEVSMGAMEELSNVSDENSETYMSFDEGTYDELEGRPLEGKIGDEVVESSNDNSLISSYDNNPDVNFQADAAIMQNNPSLEIVELAQQEILQTPENVVSQGQVAVMEGNVDNQGSFQVVNSVEESSAENLEQSNIGQMLSLAEENADYANAIGDMIDSVASNSTTQDSFADNATESGSQGLNGERGGEGDEGEEERDGEGEEERDGEGEEERDGEDEEERDGEGEEGEEGFEEGEEGEEGFEEGDEGFEEGDEGEEGFEEGGDEGDAGGPGGGFGGNNGAGDAFDDFGDDASESDIIENAS